MKLLLIFIIGLFTLQLQATIFGFFADKPESPLIDKWVTKTHTIQNHYAGWSKDESRTKSFFLQLLKSWSNDYHVPLISWLPYAYDNWTAPNPNEIIASGVYDDYIRSFVKNLKVFLSGPDGIFGTNDDRRAYLRFAHQMNGNWFPWAPNCAWSCQQTGQNIAQTAVSYVTMWRHVTKIFDDFGIRNASRLQLVWTVNNINMQDDPLEKFYPGDFYVDWIGVDGYNFGDTIPAHNWEPATKVFKDIFSQIKSVTSKKPIAVTEFGSVTSPKTADDKNQWISDAFEIFKTNNVNMILCYNLDGGNTDFAVFDGKTGDETYSFTNAYSSYRKAIQEDPMMIGSNPADIRLISDSVFIYGENRTKNFF
jgi:hypothetical protein